MYLIVARSLIVASLGISIAACGGTKASDEPAAPEQPSVTPRMHKNVEVIAQMRFAVERGELEEAQTRAHELGTELKESNYPNGWAPHLARVREAVAATKDSKGLFDAAIQSARAGGACGTCHSAFGANALKKEMEPLVASPLPRTNFMTRHSWAAERLWEGLIGPSDERWNLGAKTLLETPVLDTSNMTPEMQSLGETLLAISKGAGAATKTEQRERVYGEYLATCAACHSTYNEQQAE